MNSERVRNYLTRNKIFFETIVFFIISVSAVVVSIMTYTIMSRELELYRIEKMPKIYFEISYKNNINSNEKESEEIYAKNRGGYLQAFKIETKTILEVSRTSLTTYEYVEKNIPLIGYYESIEYDDNNINIPAIVKSSRGFLRLIMLQKLFDLTEKDKGYLSSVSVKKYLKISYKDIFNKDHIEYYYIDNTFGNNLLSQHEGEDIFKKHSKNDNDQMIIHLIDLDYLNKLVENNLTNASTL